MQQQKKDFMRIRSGRVLYLIGLAMFCLVASVKGQMPGHWDARALPTTRFSYPVYADSTAIYLFVSDSASRYFSNDGGRTWVYAHCQAPFAATKLLKTFAAPSREILYAIQSAEPSIIKSTDGGQTWSAVFDSLPFSAARFTMWSETGGSVLTPSKLYLTRDGCRSFQEASADPSLQFVFDHADGYMSFLWVDSVNGLVWNATNALTRSYVAVTHDGGSSWHLASVRMPNGDTNVSLGAGQHTGTTISILSSNDKRYFYYSTDLGESWQTTDTTAPSNLRYVAAGDESVFWAAGWQDTLHHGAEGPNTILYSNDNGLHWFRDTATLFNAWGLQFIDPRHGYVVAQATSDNFTKLFSYNEDVSAVEESLEKPFEIHLFPNPCIGKLHIASNEPVTQLSIVDVLGTKVLQLTDPGNDVVITSLIPGTYFAEIMTANRRLRASFLKISY